MEWALKKVAEKLRQWETGTKPVSSIDIMIARMFIESVLAGEVTEKKD